MDPVTLPYPFYNSFALPCGEKSAHSFCSCEIIYSFSVAIANPSSSKNYIPLTDRVCTRDTQLAQACVQAHRSTQQRQSFLVGLSSKKEIFRVENSENIVSIKRTGKSTI